MNAPLIWFWKILMRMFVLIWKTSTFQTLTWQIFVDFVETSSEIVKKYVTLLKFNSLHLIFYCCLRETTEIKRFFFSVGLVFNMFSSIT